MTTKFKRYSQTRVILTPHLNFFILYLPTLPATYVTRSRVTGYHKNNELGKMLRKGVIALFVICYWIRYVNMKVNR
jgi:hypothetical protein